MGTKNTQLLIRLSEKELKQIQQNALATDKTVSAYIRETALNMCVLNIDHACVTDHTTEISAYRNAINQLVYTIKMMGNYTPADLEYIIEKTNALLLSEKEFLNTYNKYIDSSKKQIARIVRQTVKNNIKNK